MREELMSSKGSHLKKMTTSLGITRKDRGSMGKITGSLINEVNS